MTESRHGPAGGPGDAMGSRSSESRPLIKFRTAGPGVLAGLEQGPGIWHLANGHGSRLRP